MLEVEGGTCPIAGDATEYIGRACTMQPQYKKSTDVTYPTNELLLPDTEPIIPSLVISKPFFSHVETVGYMARLLTLVTCVIVADAQRYGCGDETLGGCGCCYAIGTARCRTVGSRRAAEYEYARTVCTCTYKRTKVTSLVELNGVDH